MLETQCWCCARAAQQQPKHDQHLSNHHLTAKQGESCCGEKNSSQADPIHLYICSSGVQRYMKDLSIEFPLSKEKLGGLT